MQLLRDLHTNSHTNGKYIPSLLKVAVLLNRIDKFWFDKIKTINKNQVFVSYSEESTSTFSFICDIILNVALMQNLILVA